MPAVRGEAASQRQSTVGGSFGDLDHPRPTRTPSRGRVRPIKLGKLRNIYSTTHYIRNSPVT